MEKSVEESRSYGVCSGERTRFEEIADVDWRMGYELCLWGEGEKVNYYNNGFTLLGM